MPFPVAGLVSHFIGICGSIAADLVYDVVTCG